jgi:cytoskeletal protein CcmA (bactofilin family)
MKLRLRTSDQVLGFLDKGTNVTGELEFTGTLRIDGNFHGSVSTGDMLIIGEHALVHADIKVGEIEIHGQIFGRVEAKRRVEISATGRVRGDICTPVLLVTAGAVLDGRVEMAGDGSQEVAVATPPIEEQQNSRQERN